MSGVLPLLPRAWTLETSSCPSCRRPPTSPRLLSCLHSICTPCLNKVSLSLSAQTKWAGNHEESFGIHVTVLSIQSSQANRLSSSSLCLLLSPSLKVIILPLTKLLRGRTEAFKMFCISATIWCNLFCCPNRTVNILIFTVK